jgi:hypothetical protein
MPKKNKLFLASIALFLGLGLGLAIAASAQEEPAATTSAEVLEAVSLDENVQPEDLGISEPRILPDSPFYFLKNWGRNIRSFFTFNPVAKAELKLRFADEKLIEARKLAQIKKDPKIIEKAADNYQKEIEALKSAADRIKQKAGENPKVDQFLNKFTRHQILHQRILQKLEIQIPPEAFEKIKEVRERHLERFGEVMAKLEDRHEKIKERLENQLQKIKGSRYKDFRNSEILMEMGEKAPESIRPIIQQVQENLLTRLKNNLENMSAQDREKFESYLEKSGGEKEKQLEILENLRLKLQQNPVLKERVLNLRERILRKTTVLPSCPKITKPSSNFCKDGRIVPQKNEQGCITDFRCIIPAESGVIPQKPKEAKACISLWDPVCGKNGRTYSNACFAKLAGIEIEYKGVCKKMPATENLHRIAPKINP